MFQASGLGDWMNDSIINSLGLVAMGHMKERTGLGAEMTMD